MTPVHYHIPTPLMSLADAVDLAETLVQTTATFGRFVRAAIVNDQPSTVMIDVGGPLQTMIVRPSGIEWVRRPDWVTPSGWTPDLLGN